MYAEKSYLFRHAVLRDAAYGLMLPSVRGTLHLEVVQLVEAMFPAHERDGMAADLADHLSLAGDTPELRVRQCHYLHIAVGRAESGFRNHEARLLLDRLVEIEIPGKRWNVLCRRAGLLHRIGDPTAAERDYLRVLKGGDLEARARAGTGLALLYRQTNRPTEAITTARELVAQRREADDVPKLCQALSQLAIALHEAGDLEKSLATMRSAVDASEGADTRLRATMAINWGIMLKDAGHLEEAEEEARRAVALARQAGQADVISSALLNAAYVVLQRGRSPEAESLNEEALGIVGDNPFLRLSVLVNQAEVKLLLGDAAAGRRLFEEAVAITVQTGHGRARAITLCQFATFMAEAGDAQSAKERWREAEAFLREYGDERALQNHGAALNRACEAKGIPPIA